MKYTTNAPTYTHTRISREYLDRLRVLARANKRSAMKQLEVMIDAGMSTLTPPTQGLAEHTCTLCGVVGSDELAFSKHIKAEHMERQK